ncbi:T9SS type A sorting domain-containing protein [Ignavibacteria bacterium CHB1]|nr:MAG: T9SS C-terminal target domain-containing protein [Chlorobiota bacterium]MBV6398852.1 hypothetical protein [Ignavibacteria bacterium]MCC6884976.1 T9SS type A sorting domain-containing protein [Ignavibacteriales bacterium]MCE7952232.1 T9SS C-terminal target domain-containing protein [Chlorobi bacterium CHB7]MDL1886211.1 T9SS type A sorting domain-containing protein [Ignavibacteria bacterium CHB1]RIK49372.1 MAG: hypothetical protein DCC60_03475 [Ignavibacteriota bacterium]
MKTNFLVVIVSLFFSQTIFSQIDPDQIQPPADFIQKPLVKKVYPPFKQVPSETDAVVSVGPFDNIEVTLSPGFAETTIAVNPRDPLNFVATDNGSVMSSLNMYYTTDGGRNWTRTSTFFNAGDPVVCFDSLGNAYYCAMRQSGGQIVAIRVYKSTNKGANWVNLGDAFVQSGGVDKEWMVADQTGGPYSNNLYMSYSDFSQPVRIRFLRSTDQGITWSTPVTIFGPGNAQGSNIAVGPDGRVYLAWRGGSESFCKVSTNGGVSFDLGGIAGSYSDPGTFNSSVGRYVLKNNIRVNGFPMLACDLSNGPHRGNVYMVYGTNPPGPDVADIFMVRSTDGGVSWNTFSPVRVNDDAFGNLRDQWMPDVCVDNNGWVWVMWYDSRNDPNNLLTETYCAVSTDGGVSFQANIKVSNQPFNPNSVAVGQGSGEAKYLGDYQEISGKSVVLPYWTDGRFNTLDAFTAQLPDFGIQFSKSSDSVAPGGQKSNTVQLPVMGPYSGTVNFTANVTPVPSSGTIGLTFSQSTVSTFPGSTEIAYQVSGDVPLGNYTINVTGTENNNVRIHTRSFQLVVTNTVGVHQTETEIPEEYSLYQNFPNPFNPTTEIKFSLPVDTKISLKVFDVLGNDIYELAEGFMKSGNHSIIFDASRLPSGVYFYSLRTEGFVSTRRMLLVK